MGRDDLLLAVQQMRNNLWLDAATRVLIIKAAFYNANLDTYVAASFVFEFSLGGVMLPKVVFGTLRTVSVDFEQESLAPHFSHPAYPIFPIWHTLLFHANHRHLPAHGLRPFVFGVSRRPPPTASAPMPPSPTQVPLI